MFSMSLSVPTSSRTSGIVGGPQRLLVLTQPRPGRHSKRFADYARVSTALSVAAEDGYITDKIAPGLRPTREHHHDYSFLGESDPVGPPEHVRVRAESPFDRLLERAEAEFACCCPVLQTPRDGAECKRKLRDQIGWGDLPSVEEGLAHCAAA